MTSAVLSPDTVGMIDLSNDVYSFPPPGMREMIARAEISRGIYDDDQAAARLEAQLAAVFGKESALYLLTGTAANLVAHMTHCQPGDEVICGQFAHTFNLEAGGAQRVAGLSVRTLPQTGASIDPAAVIAAIRPDNVSQTRSKLLWVDQPSRGFVLPLVELRQLAELAWSLELKVHIDGARIFEAATALDVEVRELAGWCDTLMISFTKGLCAPVGAALVGSADFISHARRNRKVIGGEVRHSAFMVAAAEYALEHMVPRLARDRENARRLAAGISRLPSVALDRTEVESNRFVLNINQPLDPARFVAELRAKGVFVNPPVAPSRGVNIVTHFGVEEADVESAIQIISDVVETQLKAGSQRAETANYCRLCGGNDLFQVINYGPQPIAQRFVADPEADEYLHSLVLHGCEQCGLIQVVDPVPPEMLYEDVFYYLSSSKLPPHMQEEVELLSAMASDSAVLEIGCNDGSFLQALTGTSFRLCVGVEPNAHTQMLRPSPAMRIHKAYFTDCLSRTMRETYGRFDFVVARDVLDHLPDLSGFFHAVDEALTADGYLYVTVQDSQPFLQRGDCTVASEQHVNYFTLPFLERLMRRFGYEPRQVRQHNWAGGSIHMLAQRVGLPAPHKHQAGLLGEAEQFGRKVQLYTDHLREVLAGARAAGYEVFLYGGGWRGCRLSNAFGVAGEIDCVADDSSDRQGKFLPGCRLPIKAPAEVAAGSSPAVCLMAVNQEHEAAVIHGFRSMTARPVLFTSVVAPNDISHELEKLAQDLTELPGRRSRT